METDGGCELRRSRGITIFQKRNGDISRAQADNHAMLHIATAALSITSFLT